MEEILEAISAVRPALRLCAIAKQQDKACGFHLSRTQWDPYPWISEVEQPSPAAEAGLTIGDFVIEVNGEDVLGLKIDEVAQKVRLKKDAVRLLVWKSAVGEAENKLAAIFNIHKFSSFLQSTLQLIECPVCMENASSSAYQCVNGHILCGSCRLKTTKCPMCRVPLNGKGRCLIVEKLHRLIKATLSNQYDSENKLELKSKETSDNSDCVRNDPIPFCCPYSEPCDVKLKGEQAVLMHLNACHDGPIIQYSLRSDFISFAIPPQPNTLLINRYDTVFFLRILPTKQCWVSVFGDLSKAVNLNFSITCNGIEYCSCVSSLCETTESVLAQGKYFCLPKVLDKIVINIKEAKGINNE